MLLRSMRSIIGVGVVFVCTSTFALAAESKGTEVKINGQTSRLSGQWRTEWKYADHGLEKTDDYKPTATSTISLEALKLGLSGKASKAVEYSILLNFTDTANLIEYGYGTWWVTDMFGLGGGRVYVNEGGWDFKNQDYATILNSFYTTGWMPWSTGSADAIQLTMNGGPAAHVQLQLVNDVVHKCVTADATRPECMVSKTASDYEQHYFNKANKQPAWTLEYWGDFGIVSPLVQIGSYDANHSKYYDLGIAVKTSGVEAYLDYVMDNRAGDYTAQGKTGESLTLTDTATAINLDVSYTIPNTAKPFLKFTTFNVKEGATTDLAAGERKDVTYNAAAGMFDDNGQSWTIGSWCLSEGESFRPYVAYVARSGKFPKAGDADASEAKSDMMFKVGFAGEI